MFKSKLLMRLVFCLVISASVFMIAGCDTVEEEVDKVDSEEVVDVVDEKEEVIDDVVDEKEEVIGDIVLMLPPTAGNLAVSPGGDYLLFTMAGAPIDPYHIINTVSYEGEICDDWGIYWGEIEGLPTPGFEAVQVDAPNFSPDGEKLLYVGYEVYDYENVNAAIYLCQLGLPPVVYQQVHLTSDEYINGIKPVWKVDQKGIYYLTAKGVMSYNSETERVEMIYSGRDLDGLVQEGNLAPHAFFAADNYTQFAYYYDGRIDLIRFENDEPEVEVFDLGILNIRDIEFLFDGRYIALEGAYRNDLRRNSLKFLDLQRGVLAELENDYFSAGYSKNDQDQMAFIKANEANRLTFSILNDSLEEVQSASAPDFSWRVVWLDGSWCVLGSNQEGYPLYRVNFK